MLVTFSAGNAGDRRQRQRGGRQRLHRRAGHRQERAHRGGVRERPAPVDLCRGGRPGRHLHQHPERHLHLRGRLRTSRRPRSPPTARRATSSRWRRSRRVVPPTTAGSSPTWSPRAPGSCPGTPTMYQFNYDDGHQPAERAVPVRRVGGAVQHRLQVHGRHLDVEPDRRRRRRRGAGLLHRDRQPHGHRGAGEGDADQHRPRPARREQRRRQRQRLPHPQQPRGLGPDRRRRRHRRLPRAPGLREHRERRGDHRRGARVQLHLGRRACRSR